MALLLVHTLVGSARDNPSGSWAELAAVTMVVALQWFKRQPLLSILVGTALYVLLRNTRFFFDPHDGTVTMKIKLVMC